MGRRLADGRRGKIGGGFFYDRVISRMRNQQMVHKALKLEAKADGKVNPGKLGAEVVVLWGI